MALGIVAGLTLLLEKPYWKKRFSFFIPVGRMGLTNYILLLTICDLFILGNYGLSLAGKIGPLNMVHLNGSGARLLTGRFNQCE